MCMQQKCEGEGKGPTARVMAGSSAMARVAPDVEKDSFPRIRTVRRMSVPTRNVSCMTMLERYELPRDVARTSRIVARSLVADARC